MEQTAFVAPVSLAMRRGETLRAVTSSRSSFTRRQSLIPVTHRSVHPATTLDQTIPARSKTAKTTRDTRRRSVGTSSPRASVNVPMEVDDDGFDAEVLKSDVPVLVDFYAPWCGPCKLMAPLMDWAAANYDGKLKVVKINTEAHPRFVKEYGLYGLPTFAVFSEGEAFGVQEGAMGKTQLSKYIETHAPSVAP